MIDTKEKRAADVAEFVENAWAPLRHAGANELGDVLRETLQDLGETSGVVDDLKAEIETLTRDRDAALVSSGDSILRAAKLEAEVVALRSRAEGAEAEVARLRAEVAGARDLLERALKERDDARRSGTTAGYLDQKERAEKAEAEAAAQRARADAAEAEAKRLRTFKAEGHHHRLCRITTCGGNVEMHRQVGSEFVGKCDRCGEVHHTIGTYAEFEAATLRAKQQTARAEAAERERDEARADAQRARNSAAETTQTKFSEAQRAVAVLRGPLENLLEEYESSGCDCTPDRRCGVHYEVSVVEARAALADTSSTASLFFSEGEVEAAAKDGVLARDMVRVLKARRGQQ